MVIILKIKLRQQRQDQYMKQEKNKDVLKLTFSEAIATIL